MRIPVVDLKAQYRRIRVEVDAAISTVLESGNFILREQVCSFEQAFAAWCGADDAVGTSTGTAALRLALLACGVKAGDEVITVAHTSVATVTAVEQCGARVVLADIDPVRMTMDPISAHKRITKRTRAILPVHLYGCPADMVSLTRLAEERGLMVVEDCAQGHGASLNNRRVGTWGRAGAFSFYPTKNLAAYGDGGAVVTSDPQVAQGVRLLRQYGWDEERTSGVKGGNDRLDEMQAAILRVKLRHVDAWNARRRELAGLYTRLLTGSRPVLPKEPEGGVHAWHQYVVRCKGREGLRAHLAEQGIQTLVHYPVPVHLHPAYADLGYKKGDLPETERVAQEVLSLPLHPEMSDEQVQEVCAAIWSLTG